MTETENSGTQKTWFITGCSSGMGAALARAVLARGDFVIITARNTGPSLEIPAHPDSLVLELDVTRPEQIRESLAAAIAARGRLDVIVNNAGAGLLGALEDCTGEEIAACMAVNFHGPVHIMQTQRCPTIR